MVNNIVITQTGAVNVPWYALITKDIKNYPSVMIVKFVNYVFLIDPSAMDRGSLWIREFERFYSKESILANDGFHAKIGEICAKTGLSHIFRPRPTNRVIYPAEMAALLPSFPTDEASAFAHTAILRTKDQIYGTNQEITEREKVLQRQIDELNQKKRKKKKKPKIEY